MANPYFAGMLVDEDQDLLGQLTADFIYDKGIGIKFLPRTPVLTDNIMNEPVVSLFADSFDVDIFIEEESGGFIAPNAFMDFGGYGFGTKDSVTVHFDKHDCFDRMGTLPKEGDLLYIEQLDRIYELNNVDGRDAFISGGDEFSLTCTMSIFKPGEGTQHFSDALDTAESAIDKILGVTTPSKILVKFIDFSSDAPWFDHIPDLYYHPEEPPLEAFTFDKTLTTVGLGELITFDIDGNPLYAFDSTSAFDFSVEGYDPDLELAKLEAEQMLQEICDGSSDNAEIDCATPGTPIKNDILNPFDFF